MAVPGGLIPESVCSRFAKYQEERFESLAASDDRLAFELQTVHRPGLQLLALEATQKVMHPAWYSPVCMIRRVVQDLPSILILWAGTD